MIRILLTLAILFFASGCGVHSNPVAPIPSAIQNVPVSGPLLPGQVRPTVPVVRHIGDPTADDK